MLPEEDLTIRLWTLQQTLGSAEIPPKRVQAVIQHIVDIAPTVSLNVKDSIWGLEEALEWLAHECPLDELPPYEVRGKPLLKDVTNEHPNTSLPSTPRHFDSRKAKPEKNNKSTTTKKLVVECESEFEVDDLVPEYVAAKKKLFEIERQQPLKKGQESSDGDNQPDNELIVAKQEARIRKIEGDPLFDKYVAEQQWKGDKLALERTLAAERKQAHLQAKEAATSMSNQGEHETAHEKITSQHKDDVGGEADRIAAEILAEIGEEDDGIEGLFSSLPTDEVSSETGKSRTVVNSGGKSVVIRDFGKLMGMSPLKVLLDACRSRDSSAKIEYVSVSDVSYAQRHAVDIQWTKAQGIPPPIDQEDVEMIAESQRLTFEMIGIATPNKDQSQAYIATAALFHVFSHNPTEEKVSMKLPPAWRDFWDELATAKRNKVDAQDREAVKSLREMVRTRQNQELEDGVILQSAFRGRNTAKQSHDGSEASSQDRSRQSTALNGDVYKKIWADKSSTRKYQAMVQSRMQLPMWGFKEQVLSAVDNNQVVIVCGETGCGKSTQVPSFLLEHELSQGRQCKIYCTEPRRISALSLAKRVSEELGENKGDLGTFRSLVGYSIRLEANVSKETRLVYATTGIVMRMLEGSNDLHDITHLVLDEVHERSIDSDFLLIVLKRLMRQRKDLKVVLMSATVDADRFSNYLEGAPVLQVPGRTFPVQVRFLEDAVQMTGYVPADSSSKRMVDLDEDEDDATTESAQGNGSKTDLTASLQTYPARVRRTIMDMDEYRIDFDLIVQLIAHVAVDNALQPFSKAILVFLPGIAEIRTLNDYLSGDPRFAKEWLIYPLHSTIATEDQEAAFVVPPPGMRKIVLATNIAETGITIPDVTCVVDTGKHREMRFDERRQLSRLLDTFISRANAKQRRGRAGRVQEGICFHMFTKYRHDKLMNDQQTPEMLRLSLQDLAIRVKTCKIGGIEETLADALDPPSAKNIRRAIDALVDVRALTMGEELTPLGRQLARLPLDVFLGKLILLGIIFKCLDVTITIAAILSSKSPFVAPFGQRAQADIARNAYRRGDSDLLTVYNAYLAWKRVCLSAAGGGKEAQFCRKNYLSQQTLSNIEDLKGQLLVSLADSGSLALTEDERKALSRTRASSGRGGRRHQHFFEVPARVNLNSDNDIVAQSVIAWSFYPKLLVRDTPGSKSLRNIGNNQSISLHPTSVNKGHNEIKWLSYYHIMQAKTVYHAHETTAVDPFAIAILCGDVRINMYAGVITLDGNKARFAIPDWKTLLVVKVLRARLRDTMAKNFKWPGKLPTAQQEKWMDVWQRIFGGQEPGK